MKDEKSSKKNLFDKLVEEVDKIADVVTDKVESIIHPSEDDVASVQSDEDLSPMKQLLDKYPVEIPDVGDVLEGKVLDVSSNSLLLDLGLMGTGIVLGREMKDGLANGIKVKKGDVVSATLVEVENDDGYVELSIREASYEKAWEDILTKRDSGVVVSTKILDANKGGLMVEVNGVTGFLPVSQLSSEHYPRVEDGDKNKILELLKRFAGEELRVRILDADREAEKLIVSEKAALSEKERQAISSLKEGDIVEGDVSGVVNFGAFIKFIPEGGQEKDRLEGLVHISELAWQLIDDPRDIVKTGDHVRAQIIGIDDTRISLSMKALKEDPWKKVFEKYNIGDIVEGKVDKLNPFGAFVYLDKNIHGLAHISEFQEVFPNKKMEEVLSVSENYRWKILSIEPKDHRLGLLYMNDDKKASKKEDKKAKKVEEVKETKKETEKESKKENKKEVVEDAK